MPVPSATTFFSIVMIWRATQGETTLRRAGLFEAPSPTWSTRCGCTHTPRFAIAAYADAIWIGVTAMPWPIGMLPIDEPDQFFSREHDPRAFAGEVDPGQLPEAEA